MRKIPLLLLTLVLLGAAVPVAQARERNTDEPTAQQERGIFPALMRLLDRSREEGATQEQTRTEENTSSPTDTNADSTPVPTAQAQTSATTSEEEAPSQAPAPQQPTTTVSTGFGATTTPVVSTHNSSGSHLYADEGPLPRTESGALFLLSIGLALGGFLLAERDQFARLFPTTRPTFPTPPLGGSRTALP